MLLAGRKKTGTGRQGNSIQVWKTCLKNLKGSLSENQAEVSLKKIHPDTKNKAG